jgi:hypothetical protein
MHQLIELSRNPLKMFVSAYESKSIQCLIQESRSSLKIPKLRVTLYHAALKRTKKSIQLSINTSKQTCTYLSRRLRTHQAAPGTPHDNATLYEDRKAHHELSRQRNQKKPPVQKPTTLHTATASHTIAAYVSPMVVSSITEEVVLSNVVDMPRCS